MLVTITEKCNMGCSHCMDNANPDGQHMTIQTYVRVLGYLQRLNMPIIMISGGEPTLHPNIIEMIKMAQITGIKILLLSNGTFLENENLKEKILNLDIMIQITNDDRYYPRKVPIIQRPNIGYEHRIRTISPFHRAVKNNLNITTRYPPCFNFGSACCELKNYAVAIMYLRKMGKMCTPSIKINGAIAAGESNACSTIGTVTDSHETLLNNVLSLKCNTCGLRDNLDDTHKKAIRELKY